MHWKVNNIHRVQVIGIVESLLQKKESCSSRSLVNSSMGSLLTQRSLKPIIQIRSQVLLKARSKRRKVYVNLADFEHPVLGYCNVDEIVIYWGSFWCLYVFACCPFGFLHAKTCSINVFIVGKQRIVSQLDFVAVNDKCFKI